MNNEKVNQQITGTDSTVLSEDQKFRFVADWRQCGPNHSGHSASRRADHDRWLHCPRRGHRQCTQPNRDRKRRQAVIPFDTAQRISAVSGMALIVLLQIQREEVIKTIVLAGLGGMASYLFTLILKFLILYLKKKF